MGAAGVVDEPEGSPADQWQGLESLMPIVTRIIRAKLLDQTIAEDLVQETILQVLAKAHRIAPGMFEPHAGSPRVRSGSQSHCQHRCRQLRRRAGAGHPAAAELHSWAVDPSALPVRERLLILPIIGAGLFRISNAARHRRDGSAAGCGHGDRGYPTRARFCDGAARHGHGHGPHRA